MGRSGSMPVAARMRSDGDRPGLVRTPGGRAVQQDGRARHAPAPHHEVGDRVADGQEARGITGPVALAPAHDLAHEPGHARQSGRLGVVVGDVVDEAAVRGAGPPLRTTGRHDERLGVEDVGLRRGRHDGVRPRTGAPGVGDDLQRPAQRVAQAIEAARGVGRQDPRLGVETDEAADEASQPARAAAAGRC